MRTFWLCKYGMRRLLMFGVLLMLVYGLVVYMTPAATDDETSMKRDANVSRESEIHKPVVKDVEPRRQEGSELKYGRDALQKRQDVKQKLLLQARALDFIPRHFTECRDMFPENNATNYLPPQVLRNLDELNAKVKELGGMKEGYSAERWEQALMAIKLAMLPFVKTVCETGFNGGHSSVFWLTMNPNATLYSFDIGWHSYSRPMAEFISSKFPGRFQISWGDSEGTLPEFRRTHPEVACDLIVIDGGHTEPIARNDFNNLREMASCHNIIFFDNWPEPHTFTWHPIGKVWEEKKRVGELAEIFKCGSQQDLAGFSVGRIVVEKC